MITASPGGIIAGTASGQLAARAARRLDTSGGGYALLAASAARGAGFLVNGVRPARGRGSFRGAVPLGGPRGGRKRPSRPGGGSVAGGVGGGTGGRWWCPTRWGGGGGGGRATGWRG